MVNNDKGFPFRAIDRFEAWTLTLGSYPCAGLLTIYTTFLFKCYGYKKFISILPIYFKATSYLLYI